MRLWVRKVFTVALGVRGRANAEGTSVVLGGKVCLALVLLALALTACGGGRPAAISSPATSSAAASPSGTGTPCVISSSSGNCGPYLYTGNTNSNGYNTYVANNCWADPSCAQTITVTSPGNWQVTSTEPAGNSSVKTAPEAQQQFNNWCSNSKRTWCESRDERLP